jgi:hypothetical protein
MVSTDRGDGLGVVGTVVDHDRTDANMPVSTE